MDDDSEAHENGEPEKADKAEEADELERAGEADNDSADGAMHKPEL